MNTHTERDRADGFTLIELIVVTVLLGILAMTASTPLLQGLMARKQVSDDLDAIGKLRYATERIAREIRQVQYDAANGYVLTSWSSSALCFSRWGASGTTVPVSINWSGSTVIYANDSSCPTTGSTLVDNVSNLKFDFFAFEDSGNVISPSLSSPTFKNDIRYIDITLTLTQDGASLSHRTRVSLRNGI